MKLVQLSSMRWTCALLALLVLFVLAPARAVASVYGSQGVRSNPISVCFVGDALTSRPS